MEPDDDGSVVPGEPGLSLAAPSPGEVVARARDKHGIAGAMLAGAMVGLQQVIDPKPRQEIPVVIDAAGAPGDIDRDGITVSSPDGLVVHASVPQREERMPQRRPPRRRRR